MIYIAFGLYVLGMFPAFAAIYDPFEDVDNTIRVGIIIALVLWPVCAIIGTIAGIVRFLRTY
jgi:hypothetical protein